MSLKTVIAISVPCLQFSITSALQPLVNLISSLYGRP